MFERTQLSPEREAHLKRFMPLVRFVLPHKGTLNEYCHFLLELLADFALSCDERNANTAESMRFGAGFRTWNEEGGIGFLRIDNQFITTCKMYFHDGMPESGSALTNYEPWKGITFRDHGDEDSRFRNTVKVFLLSDAFEKFLQERKVTFERHNWEIQGAAG